MTFSIELLPAPLGPMMARISCSRTSKLTSASAFTPPKASDTPSIASITSPILRRTRSRSSSRRSMALGGRARRHRREGLHRVHGQVRPHRAGPPILESHLRLDDAALHARIEGVDHGRVFLADETAAHLARARELAVVGIELLVQDHEAMDLAAAELRVIGEIRVHLLHALAD